MEITPIKAEANYHEALRETEMMMMAEVGTTAIELEIPNAENSIVTDDTMSVDLSEGRSISVPIP